MDETASENTAICEFGSDVVFGMPRNLRIWMKLTTFENITIWEECEPNGLQHLNSGNIITLFKEIPKNIREHVSCVVLSPYGHITLGDGPIASVCDKPGQIMIYGNPMQKDKLMRDMLKTHALLHESIHVLDNRKGIELGMKFYSCCPEWKEAMDRDGELVFPRYYVVNDLYELEKSSGKCAAAREDFAASAVCLLDKNHPTFFKREYPNRTEILEGLFK